MASILFIWGLKSLSHPDTARRGMHLAEAGMAAAILGTLFHHDIHFFGWIIAGLILGSMVGAAFAIWVPMTAVEAGLVTRTFRSLNVRFWATAV